MKKIISLKNVVTLASVGIISLFFMNMSYAANIGKVNTETVNLREKTDGNAKILELLPNNKEVEIIEKTGDWYQVKVDGITGYVRQDLITVEEQPVAETTTPEKEETQATVEQPEQAEQAPTEEPKQETVENKEEVVVEEKEIELGKYKTTENTKLKILPVINATNTIEIKKEEEVNVTEIMNGWVCVETTSAKGWMRKEKLQKEEPKVEQQPEETKPVEQPEPEPEPEKVIKTLYVNTSSINLRKEANTSSEILANLLLNTSVDVLSEANGWSKVRVNGKEGYISTSLLSDRKQETSRSESQPRTAEKQVEKQETSTPTPPASKNGESVVAYAKQFIGTKYKYGGSSPSTGFDCSGFTSYVYKNFGISLPRTSGGQAGVGTKVDRNNLAAGDLVIYSGHVAIYVGGGQVIHAPRPGKTVCIVPINQAASNYITARRVL